MATDQLRAIDLAASRRLKSTYETAPDNQKLAAIAEVIRDIASAKSFRWHAATDAASLAMTLRSFELQNAQLLFRLAADESHFFDGLDKHLIAQWLERKPPGTFDDAELRNSFLKIKNDRGIGRCNSICGLEVTRRIEQALNCTSDEQSSKLDPILDQVTGPETPEITLQLNDWINSWMTLMHELNASGGQATETLISRFREAKLVNDSLSAGRRTSSLMEPQEGNQSNDFARMRLHNYRATDTFDAAWLAKVRDCHRKWLSFGGERIWLGSAVPHLHSMVRINLDGGSTLVDFLRLPPDGKPSATWRKQAFLLATGSRSAQIREALIEFLKILPVKGGTSARTRLWSDVVQYKNFRYQALLNIASTGSAHKAALLWFFSFPAFCRFYEDGSGGFHPHEADPAKLSESAERVVRGAVWMLANWRDPEVVATLKQTAETLLIKLITENRTANYRSLKCANACINVLGEIATADAVQAIGRIKLSIRDERLSKQITKAMVEAAKRANVTVCDLEEMAIPNCGLDDVGVKSVKLDNFTARLNVLSTTEVAVELSKADGKLVKSLPAALKSDPEISTTLKGLKNSAKEISQALPVHRQRIESLFLSSRQWPLAVWRERYLDHPLVGTIARRLIWNVSDGNGSTHSFLWREGALADLTGRPLGSVSDESIVTLWHPLEAETDDILAWRKYLLRNKVVQPFKQAHRELYPLTNAELRTATYSNRFAGHILRQHQSTALARIRGWRATLRIAADVPNDEPTHIKLPDYGIAGELWTEKAGGDDAEFTPAGAYVFISTDRVRFRRLSITDRGIGVLGDPVPLSEVPPRILSEVMRDVDLFVGVASIGNDPTWADGGADAAHPSQWRRGQANEYWRSHSAAELGVAGENRKQFLTELLPSLAIGGRCELTDRYLSVRGNLRTYRIHLGSGNILMEGDRYLCVVPRPADEDDVGTYLPFEGDRMLSIILSKAMMLAEDNKITDASILSQIKK